MRESLSKDKRVNLSEKAYSYLKEQIILGELKEGDVITENNIGEYLGMSRTPVRKALTKLELENYIKCIDGIGNIVIGLSLKDLRDIYDVRATLETLALKTAINNISESEIRIIKNEFNKSLSIYNSGKKISPVEISELDSHFHKLIILNSNNHYIINLMEVIESQVNRYKLQAYVLTDTFEESVSQHLKILESIEERDYKKSEELLISHINWSYDEMLKSLSYNSII